jgi:phosphatidylethanolamine/phosphatidyl-N-methylethanolamine N-methyltransferase
MSRSPQENGLKQMKLEAVQATYRRWAPFYDTTFGAITRRSRRKVRDHLRGRAGKLLEIGVGTGLSLPLYDAPLQVTGIDFSAEMLQRARRKVTKHDLCHVTDLHRMDARALHFDDNSFDWIVAMHVLSVVPEPERVIAEMARFCRPGGQVLIANHFSDRSMLRGMGVKVVSRLNNVLGWEADFPIQRVLGDPRLREVERDRLPPAGMMTWLVLEKVADGS